MGTAHVMFSNTSLWKVEKAPACVEHLCNGTTMRSFSLPCTCETLHSEIRGIGLESSGLLGDPLLQISTECGSVNDADRISQPSESSWTSLILGYMEAEEFHHALDLFGKMHENHVQPSRNTFVSVTKACSKLAWLDKGMAIHNEIVKEGYESDVTIGNTLVDMYGKCNSLAEAKDVFGELPAKTVVSWNALILGYADHGLAKEALMCFEQMQSKEVLPDQVTFLGSLKACASAGASDIGLKLHAEVVKQGFENHHFLSCTLLDMYAKCGLLVEAREVFDELPTSCVVSWSVLIAGYAEHGHAETALSCLTEMQGQGLLPNVVTFVCSLKACGMLRVIGKGRELHALIAAARLERNPFVNSTLVDMYAKCGSIQESRELFDEASSQDIVSWTALVAGYAEHGYHEEALHSLETMRRNGICPNVVTLVCSLKACGNIASLEQGRSLHFEIVVEEFERNTFVVNTLVGMYAKCGSLDEALDVFEELPDREIISWNAMILGYAEQGELEGVFPLSAQMQEQGLLPDSTTFVSLLKAIGNMEALEAGRRLHAQVYGCSKLQSPEVIVATALVDMYSKCGSMASAQDVFDAMQTTDLIVWTALMTGYTQHGESDVVFCIFHMMRRKGALPNSITFLTLLNVCSHVGLLDNAFECLEVMSNSYDIRHSSKHLNCMVDILLRAHQFLQTAALLECMPFQPSHVMWSTMLGHCRNQSNVKLAKFVFESAMSSEEKHSAMFVLMSDVYDNIPLKEYVGSMF